MKRVAIAVFTVGLVVCLTFGISIYNLASFKYLSNLSFLELRLTPYKIKILGDVSPNIITDFNQFSSENNLLVEAVGEDYIGNDAD